MQIEGSRILYLRDLSSPAEVPSTLPSYKRQQARWANGSLRTARKLLPGLVAKKGIGIRKVAQACLHLTYYLVHPLMLAGFLLAALTAFLGLGARGIGGATWAGIAFAAAVLLCTAAGFLYPLAAIRARKKDLRLRRQHRDTRPPRLRPLSQQFGRGRQGALQRPSLVLLAHAEVRDQGRAGRLEGQALPGSGRRQGPGGIRLRLRRRGGCLLRLPRLGLRPRLPPPRLRGLLRLRRGALPPAEPGGGGRLAPWPPSARARPAWPRR